MRNIEISQKEKQGVALGASSRTLAVLPHSEEGWSADVVGEVVRDGLGNG